MISLLERLSAAKGEVRRLERGIAAAPCLEVGHKWKFIGARACDCERDDLKTCSISVHECTICGDCDYGENDDAVRTKERCDTTGEE